MYDSREQEVELAAGVAKGDGAATESFCHQYAEAVYRFIYHRVDPQEAEDLLHETMAAALGACDGFRGQSSMFSWLCGIAKHKIADHHRRRAREERVDRLDEVVTQLVAQWEEEDVPEGVVSHATTRRMVNRVLSALPPHYQACLRQKYLGGRSMQEIGKGLNLSEQAVGSLLARAREAFRQAFRELNVEPKEAL